MDDLNSAPRAQNAPEIQAVVFDFDGLMVNTEEVFHLSGTELLRRRGKEPTPAVFHAMMGRRADEAFTRLIEIMDLKETIEELKVESTEIFFSMLDDILEPMPGLFELLELIDRRGLQKAVATSSERAYLVPLLTRFSLQDRFQALLTSEDVTQGKPHPEIYLKAAQRLSVSPANMMVLEDSEAGTRAAAAAGAHIISVPHRHSRHFAFKEAKAIANGLMDPVIVNLIRSDRR